jgi:hypothetical protein
MTISPYQIDNVLNAYNKQNKLNTRLSLNSEKVKNTTYEDTVSLTSQGTDKAEAFTKISYSLMDVILKEKTK